MVERATASRLETLTLLTTTAADFFLKLDFHPVTRDVLPAALRASPQLQGGCPASATVMHLPSGSGDLAAGHTGHWRRSSFARVLGEPGSPVTLSSDRLARPFANVVCSAALSASLGHWTGRGVGGGVYLPLGRCRGGTTWG